MKTWLPLAIALTIATLTGCSASADKTVDVAAGIRESLAKAGLKNVAVSQDRADGVVTLSGQVALESDKANAAAIAQSIAQTQVVSNQIAVIVAGDESASKTINRDLDKAIESNLDAQLVKHKLRGHVKYSVANHVVTLTGEVPSQVSRAHAEALAVAVPNVHQVVNELQVRGMKATSSKKS
jgi:osmotically-inducible protein OsmY